MKGRVEQISHAVESRYSSDVVKFFFLLRSLDIDREEIVTDIYRPDMRECKGKRHV